MYSVWNFVLCNEFSLNFVLWNEFSVKFRLKFCALKQIQSEMLCSDMNSVWNFVLWSEFSLKFCTLKFCALKFCALNRNFSPLSTIVINSNNRASNRNLDAIIFRYKIIFYKYRLIKKIKWNVIFRILKIKH